MAKRVARSSTVFKANKLLEGLHHTIGSEMKEKGFQMVSSSAWRKRVYRRGYLTIMGRRRLSLVGAVRGVRKWTRMWVVLDDDGFHWGKKPDEKEVDRIPCEILVGATRAEPPRPMMETGGFLTSLKNLTGEISGRPARSPYNIARLHVISSLKQVRCYADSPAVADVWVQTINRFCATRRDRDTSSSTTSTDLPDTGKRSSLEYAQGLADALDEALLQSKASPKESPEKFSGISSPALSGDGYASGAAAIMDVDEAKLPYTPYTLRNLNEEEKLLLSQRPESLLRMGLRAESQARKAAIERVNALEEECVLVEREKSLLTRLDVSDKAIEDITQRLYTLRGKITALEETIDEDPNGPRMATPDEEKRLDVLFLEMETLGKKLELDIMPEHIELEEQLEKCQDAINDIVIYRDGVSAEERLEAVKVEMERVQDRENPERLEKMKKLHDKLVKAVKEEKVIQKREQKKKEATQRERLAYMSPLDDDDVPDAVRFQLSAMDVRFLSMDPHQLEGLDLLKWRAAKRHFDDLAEEEDSE